MGPIISADDAFLILDKLHSEHALVSLIGSFAGLSFGCKGLVEKLSPGGFTVASADGQASVSVDLQQNGVVFTYGEPRTMSLPGIEALPEAALHAAALMMFFPPRLAADGAALLNPPAARETLFLMEIPAGL